MHLTWDRHAGKLFPQACTGKLAWLLTMEVPMEVSALTAPV
jgi:hypothetical protein